jgi:hypothetical protein
MRDCVSGEKVTGGLDLVAESVIGDSRFEAVVDDVGLIVLLDGRELFCDLRCQCKARGVQVDLSDDALDHLAVSSLKESLTLVAKDCDVFLALKLVVEHLDGLRHSTVNASTQATVRSDGHDQVSHIGARHLLVAGGGDLCQNLVHGNAQRTRLF